jgi:hypothetical protein
VVLVRRRLLAVLSIAPLVLGILAPTFAVAQSPAPPSGATLTIEPVGASAVTGLAVLTPRDADTTANVLTVGAPAGAIAVIHAGTCEAIDPLPVGLLGDVGTTGQLAATVPVSFATIANGSHVLVVHPGLDLATAIACGAIPRIDAPAATMPPTAAPTMIPTTPPTAAPTMIPTTPPTAAPTPDTACAGVDTWVAATLARFDSLKQMSDDLTTTMNAGIAAYAQALAANAVAVQQLQIDQGAAEVPASAADAQAAVIRMLQKLAEAYDLMAQAYTSGNTGVLQQGLSAASEAQGLGTAARTAIRGVATPCGITVPAV